MAVVAARGWKGEVNLRSVLGLAWVEERGDMRCVRVEEGLVPAPHVVNCWEWGKQVRRVGGVGAGGVSWPPTRLPHWQMLGTRLPLER